MFAKFYMANNDWKNANQIYHKATQIHYKTLEELGKVWYLLSAFLIIDFLKG